MTENPPPMKLRCGVYGEGLVFSVTVAHNAEVEDLQEAIVNKNKAVDPSFDVNPSRLTLYLAKKDGVWLHNDDHTDSLLRGEVDTTFTKMLSTWGVDDEEYFGPNFQRQEGEIHVLVELPTLRLGMSPHAETLIAPYERVAERLKNEPEVSQLVDAIHYVAKDPSRVCPFIVLESSSGMGKTQMAFNLMARDDVQVHYLVGDCDTASPSLGHVSKAFGLRSKSFLACVRRDLQPYSLRRWNAQYPTLAKGNMLSYPRGLQLHTFQFVRALLSGVDTTENVACSYEEVQSVIQDLARQKKKQVVFIDEFPLVDIDRTNETELRFMRNVFRTLQLPVILSSTNGSARGMVLTGNTPHSRGGDDCRWCVVVPQLDRFCDPDREQRVPKSMKVVIQQSRPLFASFALSHMEEHGLLGDVEEYEDDQQIVSYMDELTGKLAQQCREWKRLSSALATSDWFRWGQVCLFLSSQYYDSTDASQNLIQGHYARLQDAEMFELQFSGDSGLVKWELVGSGKDLAGIEPSKAHEWKVRTKFPSIDEDLLLYLSLLGGKGRRACTDADNTDVPFCVTLKEAEDAKWLDMSCAKRLERSEDGLRLEAVSVGSIVSASHWNGFAGIRLDAFLAELMYDLGMGRPVGTMETAMEEDWCSAIPESFRSLMVPFLAPLDTTWPVGLPSALKLGSITRTPNADRIDFRLSCGWLTGECKDYARPFDLDVMKKILKRVPSEYTDSSTTLRVHVVVTKVISQGTFFGAKKFKKFLEDECPHLKNALFLQYGMPNARVVSSIRGMETNEEIDPNCLVLFVARGPYDRQRNYSTRTGDENVTGDDTTTAAGGDESEALNAENRSKKKRLKKRSRRSKSAQ